MIGDERIRAGLAAVMKPFIDEAGRESTAAAIAGGAMSVVAIALLRIDDHLSTGAYDDPVEAVKAAVRHALDGLKEDAANVVAAVIEDGDD